MTQSNQSELERWASTFIESIHTGHYDYDEYFDVQTKDLCHYITANYTPNSTVESLNSQIAWLDGKVEEMREEVAERAKLKEDDVSKLDWTLPELNQLMAYCQWAENEGAYYGNKSQFLNRHTAIVVKLGSMIGEKTPHKPLGKDK